MAAGSADDDLDYYEILNVDRDASQDDIKKAYRKLALRWHPDKNPDNIEEADIMFKRIGEAYEILSDPQKRSKYDRFGKDGIKGGGGATFTFTSPEDIFRNFFGTDNPFGDMFDFGGDPFGDPFGGSRGSRGNHGGNDGRGSSLFSSFGFGGGGFGSGFGAGFGEGFGSGFGQTSFSTTSSMGGGGGRGYSRSSTTSIQSINGKTVETRTTIENGVKTVERLENGKVISRTQDAIEDGSKKTKHKRLK